MRVNQQMITHRGMPVPLPKCSVDLSVSADFTGRVVVHIKNGRAICDYQLNDADHITTLDGFIQLARQAGWKVTMPEEGASDADSHPNS